MGRDELSGDLYLFVSRTRRRAKVLLWDGTGLCVYAKRLESGRFACLRSQKETPQVRLAVSELCSWPEPAPVSPWRTAGLMCAGNS
jgi:transposase